MTHETRKSNTIRAYPSTESVCVGGGHVFVSLISL